MKLTQYSDLGLRMLMYLALRSDDSVTIQEVSDRFSISKNHLVKISHQLTKTGLIESSRGRNGGVKLARKPDEITVAAALLATEDNFDLVECFTESNHCVISDVCKLSGVFHDARQAFFEVLAETTLADLVKSRKSLEGALIPAPRQSIVKFNPKTRMKAQQFSKL